MFAQEIGIDLGTANTVVVAKRRGIVATEPSVVAVHRQTRAVVAVGREAHRMIGKTPDTILPVRPVQGGVISDMDHSTALLKHMIRKIAGNRWLRPRVLLTTQTGATSMDRRVLAEAAQQAGAGEVFLLEESVAAALGAGVPVERAIGSLIVDIGSGTTNVAILSLGGVVTSAVSNAAGDQMDEAIARYIKKEHNLLIGAPTAERLKAQFSSALPGNGGKTTITGRLLTTGIPASVTIEIGSLYDAIAESLAQIDALVLRVLEKAPPEIMADISQNGITLTGGGALMQAMDQRMQRLTGLTARVAEAPLDAVARGTSLVLERKPRIELLRIKL